MPYSGEHSCRLKSPSSFQEDSFRRISEGKLDIIIGKLKGESNTTAQAYRYPKSKWSESEARSHCQEHDGSFEPASESAALEFSFIAALHSLNAKEKTAKFYLMNTSRNRNDWGVTEKALAEALPTLTKTFLGVGPEYKADKHYAENQVVHVGKFTSYEQPQPSYAFGIADVTDQKALEKMQKGELGAVSVVIHAYRVTCSKCHVELPADESAKKHSCIKNGEAYEQIESFVFNRVDFVDVPAYPQAGLLELLADHAVPVELLAGLYESQVQPLRTGHVHKQIGDKKELTDNNETEKLQAKIKELQAQVATTEEEKKKLEEENAKLKKSQEAPSTKEECEAAGGTWNSESSTCTLPSTAALQKKLNILEQERHSAIVEAAFKARTEAGIAGKPEDERKMLTAFSDDTLKLLTVDAAKTAAVLATATAAVPKTKYAANAGTDLDAAMKELREKMGLPEIKEANKT